MKVKCISYLLQSSIRRKIQGRKIANPKKWANRWIMTDAEASRYLFKKLSSSEPFLAARFGSVELNAAWSDDLPQVLYEKKKQGIVTTMVNNAGFFPGEEKALRKFASVMKQSCANIDLLGVWFNPMEDYMISQYCSDVQLTYLRALEPYYNDEPWTRALKGKKVLVVHPFKDTIESQYHNCREKLFENPDILPEFASLRVVQAVQTIAGTQDERFQNWFEALDWMFAEAMNDDFDVALIGCGAYGLPLASMIKAEGKQAIHLGGATQLLFGIKGKRWNNHPIVSKLYNSSWVMPSDSEKPEGAKKVENACYW